MFNTYQELVDKIEELLKEREELRKKETVLTNIISKIPRKTIDKMYDTKEITSQERIFWEILQTRKESKYEKPL